MDLLIATTIVLVLAVAILLSTIFLANGHIEDQVKWTLLQLTVSKCVELERRRVKVIIEDVKARLANEDSESLTTGEVIIELEQLQYRIDRDSSNC